MLILRLAATLGFLAIALGAFGAHALKDTLAAQPRGQEYWSTATQYALVHAASLLALAPAVASGLATPSRARAAAFAWFGGVLIFSGTLMAMALGAPKFLGAITPIGGTALLAGWVLAGLSARKQS